MAEYVFTINGKDYKVNVKNIDDNIAEIELNGKNVHVNIKQLGVAQQKRKAISRKPVQQTEKKETAVGSHIISAPLPGVILDVKLREGDDVTEGQDIMIMEAMKMENSIQAPFAGKIKKIFVHREDTVQEGDKLVEVGS